MKLKRAFTLISVASAFFGILFFVGVRKNIRGNEPFVISTIAPIFSIVSFITDGLVESECLIGFNADPHGYQVVKGDSDKIQNAKIVFSNGLGLEHGVSFINTLDKAQTFDAGLYILSKFPEKIIKIDGSYDPHIWMDPSIMLCLVDPICDVLCEKFPDLSSRFIKRSVEAKSRLTKLHDYIKESISKIDDDRRYIVTAHDAFRYFVKQYLASHEELIEGMWAKRSIAPEGFAPESQISFFQISSVVEFILEHEMDVVFSEVNVNKASLQKVCQILKRKGKNVSIYHNSLYSDTFPENKIWHDFLEAYEYMIKYNVETILEAYNAK